MKTNSFKIKDQKSGPKESQINPNLYSNIFHALSPSKTNASTTTTTTPSSSPPKQRIQPSDIPALANAFSGAVGGAVASFLVFPLDVVTTRLQVQEKLLAQLQQDQAIAIAKAAATAASVVTSSSSSNVNNHQELKYPQCPADTTVLPVDALLPENVLYKGVWDATRRIYTEEGIAAFYDGAIQGTFSIMLSAFLYFYAYDILRTARLKQVAHRTRSGRPPSTLGIAEELLIGTLAGIFCKFFTAPLNNIVTRQQTAALLAHASHPEWKRVKSNVDLHKTYTPKHQIRVGGVAPFDNKDDATGLGNNNSTSNINPQQQHYTPQKHHESVSALKIAKEIYSERGIRGFWTGFEATIFLSVNPSLTYYFFQMLKVLFIRGDGGMTKAERQRRRDNPTSWELFIFSASAKTAASLLTYPLILVKTQMQVNKKKLQKEQQQKIGNKTSSSSSSLFQSFSELLSSSTTTSTKNNNNNKKNKFLNLYQGASGQILKGFFSQGITMLTKDQIARLIIYLYFIISKLYRQIF